MRPFKVSQPISELREVYPEGVKLIDVAKRVDDAELNSIARLWLSEGIPYAFKEIPALYESIRSWIGAQLNVHPKEITLIGSARLGSSTVPKKLGKIFDPSSDLDWSIISEVLFDKCCVEFSTWRKDFECGVVKPRNTNEKMYWDDNLDSCQNTIKRGFIDPYKIPTWHRYPLSRLIADTMWRVKARSEKTDGAPQFCKATLRVYRNWRCFVKQMVINLGHAAKVHSRNFR